MLPRVGPFSYSVTGITDVSVGAGSSVGPITFRFPRAVFVTGLVMIPRSGARADLAALRLRVQDESFAELVSDGRGVKLETGMLGLAGLTVVGPAFQELELVRAFALQRPLQVHDTWHFTVSNVGSGAVTPELHIQFEEPNG